MFLINAFKSAINFLSAPQYLVTAMLVLLLVGLRSKLLWSKRGGVFLLVLIGIGLAFASAPAAPELASTP